MENSERTCADEVKLSLLDDDGRRENGVKIPDGKCGESGTPFDNYVDTRDRLAEKCEYGLLGIVGRNDVGTRSNKSPTSYSSSSSDPDSADSSDVIVKGLFERGTWGNKLEFFLAIMGYTVGVGSVWRFPIICRYGCKTFTSGNKGGGREYLCL